MTGSKIVLFCLLTSVIFIRCERATGEGLDALLRPLEMKSEEAVKITERKEITEEKKGANTYTITAKEICEELARLFKLKYEIDGQLTLSFLRPFSDIDLKSMDWSLEIKDVPTNGLASSNMISFLIKEKGVEVGQWRVGIRCELWKEAFVARYAIARGKPIKESDFKGRLVEVMSLRKNIVPPSTDLKLFETTQSIPADGIFSWDEITKIPDVRNGEVVEIVAEEGLMRLATKGMALENGCKGDFIPVRNIQSGKNIQGQVVDEKTIKIHF
ncbi:MAG: flagella basal body P-ring formation protein FlgA [Verrucomicrobia bacterium GWC2_42_7]|nr:MAG: flagella basal body P-ring formation protein FlgA [Verrucomicrobia bacterium GWC2_42_7]